MIPRTVLLFLSVVVPTLSAGCPPADVPKDHAINRDGAWHRPGDSDPLTNCSECHGEDLLGADGPSCFDCHDQRW